MNKPVRHPLGAKVTPNHEKNGSRWPEAQARFLRGCSLGQIDRDNREVGRNSSLKPHVHPLPVDADREARHGAARETRRLVGSLPHASSGRDVIRARLEP
jgi:hypothetical protein